MDKLAEQFGILILSRRRALGLSQEALAGKASLHVTYVSLVERGKRAPTIVVVKKLADALGSTMTSLMQELERGVPDGDDARPPKRKKKKGMDPPEA